MPARKMYFTFNKDVEINKENIKSLKEFIVDSLDEEEIQKVKDAFCTEEFDKNFFKFLIKEIKGFDCVPIEGDYCSEKTKAIISIIYHIIGREPSQPEGPLGLKYLYDEWDYEGCGYEDHYHLTFASEDKEIKKFTKEAEEAIKKINRKVCFCLSTEQSSRGISAKTSAKADHNAAVFNNYYQAYATPMQSIEEFSRLNSIGIKAKLVIEN